MKHLPEDEEKYVDLLVAKTKVLRNVVILLTLVLVITLVGPNNLKLSFDSSEKNAAEYTAEQAHQENEIVNGVHTPTGLIANEGYEIVAAQCGACHSLKLVTQNKANREGWVSIIQWMQETQKPLGPGRK